MGLDQMAISRQEAEQQKTNSLFSSGHLLFLHGRKMNI